MRELSSEFGNIPLMNIEHTGFGAGNMNFKDRPNVLRLFVGEMYEGEGYPSPIPPPPGGGGRGGGEKTTGQKIFFIEAKN